MFTLMYTCVCKTVVIAADIKSLDEVKCGKCGAPYPNDKLRAIMPSLEEIEREYALKGMVDKIAGLLEGARRKNPAIANC